MTNSASGSEKPSCHVKMVVHRNRDAEEILEEAIEALEELENASEIDGNDEAARAYRVAKTVLQEKSLPRVDDYHSENHWKT